MTTLLCLTVAIFFEARGEPIEGQFAVGQVILNRVDDPRYPDTVCDVVYEDRAFSFTHDGKSDRLPKKPTGATERAREVASSLLRWGYPLTSTHFHTASVEPLWSKSFKLDTRIGNHLFYTNTTPYK